MAGIGSIGFGGDNGPAISAPLSYPGGVALDIAGNLYIADSFKNKVRRVAGGIITTIAGTGSPGLDGVGGPPTSLQLNMPERITTDAMGNLYITDSSGHRVLKVAGNIVSVVAGTGTPGFSGDNGAAQSTRSSRIHSELP